MGLAGEDKFFEICLKLNCMLYFGVFPDKIRFYFKASKALKGFTGKFEQNKK